MVTLSAIVSAYYAEEYLKGRLENLFGQSLVPEVIIVCKEGSKEHEIAKAFDAKIITTQDIPTIYEAWNMAIKQASGEYITSANCDDRLYPRALEKLASVLDQHENYAVAYFYVDRVHEIDGKPFDVFQWMQGGIVELLTKGCFLGPMPMWRKSLHDTYGYFLESDMLANGETYKYQVVSDYEFWMRLAENKEKFFLIQEILGAYLDRPESAEKREPLRRIWEDARMKAKYRSKYERIK